MIQKFVLEFILHAHNTSAEKIKSSLAEFGEDLSVCADGLDKCSKDFKINLRTDEPTIIFDLCSQIGRIKSVKINEEGRQ